MVKPTIFFGARAEILALIISILEPEPNFLALDFFLFRSQISISLLEVVLGLLHHLHLVLDLQVGLRLLKMVPNDFPWPKT